MFAKQAIAFLKKSSAKNFCSKSQRLNVGLVERGAKRNHNPPMVCATASSQKFFAELFFKKATSFFLESLYLV
jgi:hypothetical protein